MSDRSQPRKNECLKCPECLGEKFWLDAPEDRPQVGIQLADVRLDRENGQIPRTVFKEHPLLKNSRIIRNPRGTVFPLTSDEVSAILEFWNGETIQPSVLPGGEMEGERRLRMHYARERSRRLIDQKRNAFAGEHDGQVFCELCGFNFADRYPEELGSGFIEVHHIKPLAELDEARKTALSDLMLVCSNCHRMIHRTKDAEANLNCLLAHFEV